MQPTYGTQFMTSTTFHYWSVYHSRLFNTAAVADLATSRLRYSRRVFRFDETWATNFIEVSSAADSNQLLPELISNNASLIALYRLLASSNSDMMIYVRGLHSFELGCGNKVVPWIVLNPSQQEKKTSQQQASLSPGNLRRQEIVLPPSPKTRSRNFSLKASTYSSHTSKSQTNPIILPILGLLHPQGWSGAQVLTLGHGSIRDLRNPLNFILAKMSAKWHPMWHFWSEIHGLALLAKDWIWLLTALQHKSSFRTVYHGKLIVNDTCDNIRI
jgi:hypothetical protein